MELTLRIATAADAGVLGVMNRQLADDEHSRNPLGVDALAARMEKWFAEGWTGVLFHRADVVGYSVFQVGSDYYQPAIPEVYIRQFFIRREHRGRGIGRQAFELLRSTQFPPRSRIHLDVLTANPPGQRFWASLGFQPYSTAMRLE